MQTIRKSQKIGIFDSAGKLRLGANTRFEWQGGLKLNTWAGVSGYADCGGWLPEDVDSWTYTGRGNSASQVYHSTAGFPTNSKAKIPYEESVWLYSTNGPEPVGDVPANTSVYCTFTVNAQ
jgi:hypothetical protein